MRAGRPSLLVFAPVGALVVPDELVAMPAQRFQDQLRAAINGLFRQLDDPSSYRPEKFAGQMRAVNALL